MKLLLIGKTGQLGWELRRSCMTLGEIVAVDYPEVDLADIKALRELIHTVKPDILLNPAAYTAVDRAESEYELARLVNGVAPGVMAEEMKKLGGALIHYSTDYVFDGEKGTAYIEQDAPNPINADLLPVRNTLITSRKSARAAAVRTKPRERTSIVMTKAHATITIP